MRFALAVSVSVVAVACASSPEAPPATPNSTTVAAERPRPQPVPRELTSAMIQPVLAEMDTAARHCYVLEFGGQQSDGGTVVVDWVIDASGKVASAKIVESSIESEDFSACLVKAARELEFPAAQRPTGLRKPYHFYRTTSDAST
jgi:TonB family protein